MLLKYNTCHCCSITYLKFVTLLGELIINYFIYVTLDTVHSTTKEAFYGFMYSFRRFPVETTAESFR